MSKRKKMIEHLIFITSSKNHRILNMQNRLKTTFACLSLLFLLGCSDTTDKKTENTSHKQSSIEKNAQSTHQGNDKILVMVNGKPVTSHDLENYIKLLHKSNHEQITNQDKQIDILHFMIKKQIIAAIAEKELDDEQRAFLQLKINEYKENLFNDYYLKKYTSTEQITNEMMITFYKNNYDEKIIRQYEMIATSTKIDSNRLKQFMDDTKNLKNKKNWQTYTRLLQKKGYPIQYYYGNENAKWLYPSNILYIKHLEPGQSSGVILQKGKIHFIRFISEKKQSPAPFNNVRNEILIKLQKEVQKKHSRKIVDEILKNANIQYHNDTVTNTNIYATVNGEKISNEELIYISKRIFGNTHNKMIHDDYIKILKGMAIKRAIYQAAMKKISTEEQHQLHGIIGIFHDQTLIDNYLKNHVKPKQITNEMITTTYKKRFGNTTHDYEMIKATQVATEEKKTSIMKTMQEVTSKKDWQKAATHIQHIQFSQGKINSETLHPQLKEKLLTMKPASEISLTTIGNKPILFRVKSGMGLPNQSIVTIHARLRKELEIKEFENIKRQTLNALLKNTKIEYIDRSFAP